MTMRYRFTAGFLATLLGASLFAVGAPSAHASSKGRKNVALGLGAVAVYELLRGKTSTGLIAGAGAAYAYKRYQDTRKNERRYGRYGSSYRTNGAGSGFQFPVQYPGGSYSSDGYQYQNSGYDPNNTLGGRLPQFFQRHHSHGG